MSARVTCLWKPALTSHGHACVTLRQSRGRVAGLLRSSVACGGGVACIPDLSCPYSHTTHVLQTYKQASEQQANRKTSHAHTQFTFQGLSHTACMSPARTTTIFNHLAFNPPNLRATSTVRFVFYGIWLPIAYHFQIFCVPLFLCWKSAKCF